VSDTTPTRSSATLQTSARLSLHLREQAATGAAVSTQEHLRFQLDHALARDAVHIPLDTALLLRGLRERSLTPLLLHSNAGAASDSNARRTYLRRPDLGRTLHPDSVADLQTATASGAPGLDSETWAGPTQKPGAPSVDSDGWGTNTVHPRTLLLIADGLSALALERHALPLADAVLALVPDPLPVIPVLQNARVAIADEIGALLHADITVLLIGERPGLSSPDSLGCYITWNPRPGRTDAERNCISNIRGDEGLSYAEAAHRIAHYIVEAQRLQTTGIAVKDPDLIPLLSPGR
jgi:ethanolamine ammonia-lyase small subunit